MKTIMAVCVGNICRSPIAEAVLKKNLPNRIVFSAGLGALIGHPIEKTAAEIAEKDGLEIKTHRAQQITKYLCEKSDLILVMETKHKNEIEKNFPFTKGRVHCLGHTSENKKIEIEDPYRKDRDFFLKTHEIIKKSAESWAEKIKRIDP